MNLQISKFKEGRIARMNKATTKSLSKVFGFLALMVVVGGLYGCNGNMYFRPDRTAVDESGNPRTVTEARSLEEGIIQAFPDLPVPASHKIDLVESVIFSSPTQTVGKIVLRGRADSASLYRFFEDSMAAKGWSTVNAFQSSVSSLYFAKPGRFVAIVITQDSTVYINIGPE
tara:strand:- start:372207 stop:372722 length:516 start_codon:yes stop_codon:yes gene_type:complete